MIVTLANLKEATPQQVFDHVVNHLRAQKFRSIGADGTCFYRGEDGLKCAAGALIADTEYHPEMDMPEDGYGTSWVNLVARGLVPDAHQKLIRELQLIHDSQNGQWDTAFQQTAQKFQLIYTQPSKEAA